MTPGDRAAAQAALTEGRGVYGRLDQIRGPEDAAADIMDLWGAAESAMRAMLGGSTLSGQDLVRELRQRGILNLEQANALASFWDARSRVEDVGYKPTLTDVGYARVGFNELARAVSESGTNVAPTAQHTGASRTPGVVSVPSPEPAGAVPPPPIVEPVRPVARRSSAVLLVGAVVLVLALLVTAAFFMMGRSSYDRDMAEAVDMMRGGRVEPARMAFNKIARDHQDQAEPHVFLARLARTDGDDNGARQELATAIRLEPGNELAQREMGLLLLSQNDPELARRFLVRAVQLAPTDSAAQGYLGCALLRLNRVEEGQRFLSRAGNGVWSSCSASTTAAPPGAPLPVPR